MRTNAKAALLLLYPVTAHTTSTTETRGGTSSVVLILTAPRFPSS